MILSFPHWCCKGWGSGLHDLLSRCNNTYISTFPSLPFFGIGTSYLVLHSIDFHCPSTPLTPGSRGVIALPVRIVTQLGTTNPDPALLRSCEVEAHIEAVLKRRVVNILEIHHRWHDGPQPKSLVESGVDFADRAAQILNGSGQLVELRG